MRALNRRMAGFGCLVLALALSTAAPAGEPVEFSKQLAALVKSAHEQLAEVRNRLDQVEAYLGSGSAHGAAGGNRGSVLATAGRGEFTDLERAARNLADVGNQVVSLAGKCGSESHEVAAKFRSYTQRISSGISQIESGSSAMMEMSTSKIRRDLDATEQQLQSVAGLSGNCS
jgi:hypothetical protein